MTPLKIVSHVGRQAIARLRAHRLILVKIALTVLAMFCGAGSASAAGVEVRVGALENSPPMSWLDQDGRFQGYSIDMMSEVCAELEWSCRFVPSSIAGVIGDLRTGRIDIAAMSLLPTDERRAQILLARPFYTSISVWFGKVNTRPGEQGIRVAVVRGSAQDRYAVRHGWNTIEVASNNELAKTVLDGKADGMLAPMMTVLGFRSDPAVQAMRLIVQPVNEPELTGATSFGISPDKPWLKGKVDAALEKLERNGVYDRINSRYVPFRVN